LADGTGMVMDVGSEVDVRQSARRRDVRLTQGQVFFTVAHDPKRPFMVLAGHNVITDVGTAFAVAVQQKDTSVVLASGRVRVAHSGQAFEIVDLQPGQQFVQRDSRPGEVTSVDVDAKLAWRTGQMELDHTPLAEAVAQLNRHITTPISVGDAKAAALKLSGRYRLDDPQGFAQSIAAIYPVQVRSRRDGGIEIASR
jgi:transmembrane sensor